MQNEEISSGKNVLLPNQFSSGSALRVSMLILSELDEHFTRRRRWAAPVAVPEASS